VSPDNVLIGVDGHARILDFGVARALGRMQATGAGKVKGKLSYLTPEQVKGEPLTRRADVFSASVVMWECLTGRRLFEGDHMGEVANKVTHELISPPSTFNRTLPRKYDDIVMKGLERDPSMRWDTTERMAEAIETSGKPASTGRVGKWIKGVATERLTRRSEELAAVELTPVGGIALPKPEDSNTACASEGEDSFKAAAIQVLRMRSRTRPTTEEGTDIIETSAPIVDPPTQVDPRRGELVPKKPSPPVAQPVAPPVAQPVAPLLHPNFKPIRTVERVAEPRTGEPRAVEPRTTGEPRVVEARVAVPEPPKNHPAAPAPPKTVVHVPTPPTSDPELGLPSPRESIPVDLSDLSDSDESQALDAVSSVRPVAASTPNRRTLVAGIGVALGVVALAAVGVLAWNQPAEEPRSGSPVEGVPPAPTAARPAEEPKTEQPAGAAEPTVPDGSKEPELPTETTVNAPPPKTTVAARPKSAPKIASKQPPPRAVPRPGPAPRATPKPAPADTLFERE
jgi:hypothetical protein